MTKKEFLDMAKLIGDKLSSEAIWYRNQCTWIGMNEIPDDNIEEYLRYNTVQTIYEPLDSSLYEGTCGIAYFLSLLYNITHEKRHLDAAKGAIRNAIYQIKDDNSDFGFYSGKTGIIFVAVKMGILLKDDLLIQQTRNLLDSLKHLIKKEHLLDVIAGNAGIIPPLIFLSDFFKDEKILNIAATLAYEIISKATIENTGMSWGQECNGANNAIHNLTGFAHGASGFGHALLELHKKTGIPKFLEVGMQAYEYENALFAEKYNNWPDFRDDVLNMTSKSSLEGSLGWCHGSPGICLTRLRAYDLYKKEQFRIHLEPALNNLNQKIKEATQEPFDYCLCHGLGAISETLIYASKVLHDSRYYKMAENIGISGIKHFESSEDLLFDIAGNGMQGLMLGISGIGYNYLRLYDPVNTPSVLLFQ